MKGVGEEAAKQYKVSAIVIDDDLDGRDLFVELLEMNGVHVAATGSDGGDALGLYKQYRPDIAFLDYFMPEHDGIYAARKIREFDPHARIALVSGADLEGNEYQALIDVFIKKPIIIEKVLKAINRMGCTVGASTQNF